MSQLRNATKMNVNDHRSATHTVNREYAFNYLSSGLFTPQTLSWISLGACNHFKILTLFWHRLQGITSLPPSCFSLLGLVSPPSFCEFPQSKWYSFVRGVHVENHRCNASEDDFLECHNNSRLFSVDSHDKPNMLTASSSLPYGTCFVTCISHWSFLYPYHSPFFCDMSNARLLTPTSGHHFLCPNLGLFRWTIIRIIHLMNAID